ncbi:MAG: sulfatase-like hydrolase/transferase [Planctomycetes bacterium]|nr:sulfatase-like hydrolase/transferase [Planctomycetota bacterium]
MIALLLTLFTQAAPTSAPAAPPRPNFIFVLGEGEGWSSTSIDMDGADPSHARPAGLTPNLERIAAVGLRFSDFYASCPRCTPSRASFLTGISPAKLHMTYVNEGGANRREEPTPRKLAPPSPVAQLPFEAPTTASVLRASGYATAHFGKWHVGRADPTRHGFDVSDGANTNQGPERGVEPNPAQFAALTERGLEFIRAQAKAGKPFFLQMSHYSASNESQCTEESLAAARKLLKDASGKTLGSAAGMHALDTQLGRVLALLDELDLDERTFVFYSADHGTPGGAGRRAGPNPPLSGGKGSVSEGGIRVPFLVRGPGVRRGAVSTVRASGMDLLPTLAELAGAPLPTSDKPDEPFAVEGGSLAGVLRGDDAQAVKRPRAELVIHFPHYDLDNGGPASALFDGPWKLVRNYERGSLALYDIRADSGEHNDLASSQPELVKELDKKLTDYLRAVRAQLPTPIAADGAPPAAPAQPKKPGKRKESEREEG